MADEQGPVRDRLPARGPDLEADRDLRLPPVPRGVHVPAHEEVEARHPVREAAVELLLRVGEGVPGLHRRREDGPLADAYWNRS